MLLAPAALLTATPLFAETVWLADVVELFRPYAAVAVLACALSILPLRSKGAYLAAFILVAVNAAMLIGAAGAGPASERGAETREVTLTAATFNCRFDNPDSEAFARWVRRTQPDLIALEELPAGWTATLGALSDLYPYRASTLGAVVGDTDILSRHPIETVETYAPSSDGRVAVAAKVAVGGRSFQMFAIHPNTPRTHAGWAQRNLFLAGASDWIAATSASRPHLVLGDWNVAPWSPYFNAFTQAAGVRIADARVWPRPTRVLTRFAGVDLGSPIDHVGISGEFGAQGCALGPGLGSDHRPLVCRLSL